MAEQDITRRKMIQTSAAASAAMFVAPSLVRGSQTNEKIKLGIIGTGGRGSWIADLFQQHGGYQVTALHDAFQDRVDEAGEKLGVSAEHRHTGLDGYHALLADDVDAVAIISPPYFHPEQAAAAVEAGKHVYLAKPIAVDVPGTLSIEQTAKTAAGKNLAFLVDFQTRANEFYIEAIRRVHAGEIGDLVFGESLYHADALGLQAEPTSEPANRLRNWVFEKSLSGDIITEQNIHTLDVMNWIMDNRKPLHASGTGGRKVRTHVGDCWDYFTLVFDYGDGVGVTFSSRQFKGHGTPPGGIRNRMYGTTGAIDTQYGGVVTIRGENAYRGGATSDIYQSGAVANIATFHDDVKQGRYEHPTVAPSVMSTLVSILGRTAGYEGTRVTWQQMMDANETWQPDFLDAL